MTLGGKSLFASLLINSGFVAVMAGVVLYPASKTVPVTADPDDSGMGWSLVMEESAHQTSTDTSENEEHAEPEKIGRAHV